MRLKKKKSSWLPQQQLTQLETRIQPGAQSCITLTQEKKFNICTDPIKVNWQVYCGYQLSAAAQNHILHPLLWIWLTWVQWPPPSRSDISSNTGATADDRRCRDDKLRERTLRPAARVITAQREDERRRARSERERTTPLLKGLT